MRPPPGSETPRDVELETILLRAFPGDRIESWVSLEGGVSARATKATLTLPDGARRDVVVRRPTCRTRAEARLVVAREHAVLTRVAAHGIPTPTPLFLDQTAAALVLDYVDGAPDFSPADFRAMLEQLATALAQLHRCFLGTDLGFLPRRAESVERSVSHTPERPDLTLDEPKLRAVLTKRWPWPEHNASTLLHGDYWPGNVLWRAGRLVAVLDWEEAETGDPLSDVAVTRLDLLWAFGDGAMHAFTEYYRAQTSLDWRNLPHWDLVAALRPLSNLARWAPAYAAPTIGRPDVTETTMRAGHSRFVEQALEHLR